MRFVPLTEPNGSKPEDALETEYGSAYEVGKLRLGDSCLYFRQGLKVFYIAYTDIHRYFRRVMQVPAKLCCGRGNFDVESLVICDETKELAEIQMPGTRAAKVVIERLKELAPNAIVGKLPAAAAAEQEAAL